MPQQECKLTRAAQFDPNRCQAVNVGMEGGQCPYLAKEDSNFCSMHGGNRGGEAVKKSSLRNYMLGKWQARVAELGESDGVKSLRDEIGITRMLLEEVFKRCGDSDELMLYSPKMMDFVMKIEKLVVSCHKLEQSTGKLLDKQAALALASTIVGIIGQHVTDSNVVDLIATQICEAIVGMSPDLLSEEKR